MEPILRSRSYNAGAVKIYNTTSSLARFGNKLFSSTLKKRQMKTAPITSNENSLLLIFFTSEISM
jgi:hypothetical protein